jgi:hypothetical protein
MQSLDKGKSNRPIPSSNSSVGSIDYKMGLKCSPAAVDNTHTINNENAIDTTAATASYPLTIPAVNTLFSRSAETRRESFRVQPSSTRQRTGTKAYSLISETISY